MKRKLIIPMISIILFLLLINVKEVKAASFSIKSSTATVEPGKSFDVIITTDGAGYVNLTCSNGSLNESYIWVEKESKRVKCTAASTGDAVKISGAGVVADFSTGKDENKADATTVKIVKEEPKQETPATTQTSTPTTGNNTTTKKTTTTKETTTKKEEKKVEEVYINSISLKGIKEDGTSSIVELSPAFNKTTYDYTARVSPDVNKIIIEKDAGNYTSNIIVKGEGNINEGENIITIQLAVENQQAKTYTIKVTKEAKQEITEEISESVNEEENNEINVEEHKETKTVTMPVWTFVVLEMVIILAEAFAIKFIPWTKIFKIKK